MSLTLVTLAGLVALLIVAAIAMAPPRLVPWPDYRAVWSDTSKLRVAIAHRITADRTDERDAAQATAKALKAEVKALKDQNANLKRRLAETETRLYATQELALPEALALVAAYRERVAAGSNADEGEAGQIGGAAAFGLKP